MTEKIGLSSSLMWKPSPKQIRAITRMAIALGITEPLEETPRNRKEARDMIYQLRGMLKAQNSK